MINNFNSNLGLGAFGTFGEPSGYQQAFYFEGVFGRSLDLNTNAIELFPGNRLYAVKREVVGNISRISCATYAHAKELNSNRGGTFIGVSVVLQNCLLDAELIYQLLDEHYRNTIDNAENIINHTLQVGAAELLTIVEPAIYSAVSEMIQAENSATQLRSVDLGKIYLVDGYNAQASEKENIVTFFHEAVNHFNEFDTLYYTSDNPVLDYVRQKGILKVVSWDEFTGYHEEQQALKARLQEQEETAERERLSIVAENQRAEQIRTQQLEAARREEENRQKRLAERRQADKGRRLNNTLTDGSLPRLTATIVGSRKLTPASPWAEEKIFGISIDQSLLEIWHFEPGKQWKIKELEQRVMEHNLLVQWVRELEGSESLQKKQNLRHEDRSNDRLNERHGKDRKIVLMNVVILSLIIAGLLIYVLVLKGNNSSENQYLRRPTVTQELSDSELSISDEQQPLNPRPNSELKANDVNQLAGKKIRDKFLLDIVGIIFNDNPADIGHPFKGQEKAYSQLLLKRNKNCFRRENGLEICISDTLKRIPSLKK